MSFYQNTIGRIYRHEALDFNGNVKPHLAALLAEGEAARSALDAECDRILPFAVQLMSRHSETGIAPDGSNHQINLAKELSSLGCTADVLDLAECLERHPEIARAIPGGFFVAALG